MGSTRRRHSTGPQARPSRARKSTASKLNTGRKGAVPPDDLGAMLGRLSDSLSIIATATNALVHAQESTGTLTPEDVGEEVTTLEHGVSALRSAYDELDVAVRRLLP